MAFFDSFSKKISAAGQTAVQKTKEVADIAKINSAISDEERKSNNLYYQIGRLYVAKHGSSFENDFGPMITALKESEARISAYRQQVHDIKGIVRCEKCGAQVPMGIAFCSTCGSAMPKPANAPTSGDMIRCGGCGAVINKSMRFCTSCGTPNNYNDPAPPASQIPPPPVHNPVPSVNPTQQSVPAAPSMPAAAAAPSHFENTCSSNPEAMPKACHKCGTVVPADNAFCTQCGEKI